MTSQAEPEATGPDLGPVHPSIVPHLPHLPTGRVRWSTAGTTVGAAALLCLSAYAGTGLLLAAGLFAVAALAFGWPSLLALPSPRGTTAVVALGGTLAVLAVGLARDEPLLQWLSLAIAGSVLAEFVHQLARRDGRPRVVESSTGAVTGVTVLASLSAVLALPGTPSGAAGVVVVVLPVTLALVLQLVPVPARLSAAGGAVAAMLLGALLGGLLTGPTLVAGVVSAGLGSVVALMMHRLLAVLPAAGWAPGWLALAIAPLASSGMVGYVVLRLLAG